MVTIDIPFDYYLATTNEALLLPFLNYLLLLRMIRVSFIGTNIVIIYILASSLVACIKL